MMRFLRGGSKKNSTANRNAETVSSNGPALDTSQESIVIEPVKNPKDLSPSELHEWREYERAFIRLNDDSSAHIWFLISVAWLRKWKDFLNKDAPFPGPIDNSNLVDEASGLPLPGLVVVEDYRGVNARMWTFWLKRYGGGPELRRAILDIYTPAVDDLDGTSATPVLPRGSSEDLDATRIVPRKKLETVAEAPPAANRSATPRGRTSKQSQSQSASSSRAKSVPPAREKAQKKLCCDKCDGPHETDACPHFKKVREKHKDAWSMLGKKGASDESAEPVIIPAARVIRQPGDGSCLYHSLSYGLPGTSQASALRKEICAYMEANPEIEIGDNILEDWVRYDNGCSVGEYAQSMRGSSKWGGAIEMATFSKMKRVNVHVFESCSDGYKRISAFECPGASETVRVVYQGRSHYDALAV